MPACWHHLDKTSKRFDRSPRLRSPAHLLLPRRRPLTAVQVLKTPLVAGLKAFIDFPLVRLPHWGYCLTGSHQNVDVAKDCRKFHSCALVESALLLDVLPVFLHEQLGALLDHPQRWLAVDRG